MIFFFLQKKVTNLSFNVTENQVRKLVQPLNPVLVLFMESDDRKTRNAFIAFLNRSEAVDAVSAFEEKNRGSACSCYLVETKEVGNYLTYTEEDMAQNDPLLLNTSSFFFFIIIL